MTQEYLKRIPTSSGNRSVFTWSGWVKRNNINQDYYLFSSGDDANNIFYVSIRRDVNNNNLTVLFRDGDTTSHTLVFNNNSFRDPASWMHLFVAVDTTIVDSKSDRCKVYINGKRLTGWTTDQLANITQNGVTSTNAQGELHTIGEYSVTSGSYSDMQIFDYFLIDGQALTPDVFGFYKDGDGYMSSGTSNATDFRPGQWMPHSPTKIKKDVNRRGGFGVNGFYLPLNDSSNPGADFHCAPDTIIKLKGEDLPQPRNGAPTTSDAYVSQLRPEVSTLGFDGCVKMDGTQRLSVADTAALDLGTGDFTIEGFYYLKDEGGYHSLFDFRGTNATGLYPALFKDTTENKLYYYVNGTTIDDIPMRYGEWMHVVICRSSGTTRAFVDGKLAGSYSDTTNYISSDLYIGMSTSNSHGIYGFVSNFRIVKGTALYTANFTPPTSPLENVTNTILLCANSSTSATASTVTPSTITAIGSPIATRNELTGSIVLAVPGISTATGANLVSNGHFDTNTTGWTAGNSGTLSVDSGRLKVTNGTSSAGYAYQEITVVIGQRYTVNLEGITGTSASNIRIGTAANSASYGNKIGSGLANISLTATSTSLYVTLKPNSNTNGNNAFFDNIEVKQEDAPRDYSADIRGSGTNKTVQATLGTGGVGYNIPSYYGSAINANDNNCGYAFSGADSAFVCPGDFTVELWLDPVVATQPQGNPRILGQTNNSGGKWDIYIDQNTSTNRIYTMGGSVSITGGNGSSYGNFVPGQWNHFCLERSGSIMTTYMNGVAVYTQTYTNTIGTTDFLYLGSYGDQVGAPGYGITGKIMDFRFYKGVAKYKGGFDVPKPYAPIGIEAFRTTADTCKNNFAAFNRLIGAGTASGDTVPALKDGNLFLDNANQTQTQSSIGMSSGKWYCEYRLVGSSVAATGYFGVVGDGPASKNNQNTYASVGFSHIRPGTGSNSYTKNWTATQLTTMSPALGYANGDIFGFALDLDSSPKNIKYYRNGTLIHTDSTIGDSGHYYFLAMRTNDGVSGANWSDVYANFGQSPSFSGTVTAGTNADDSGKGLFKYTPPSGYLALCEDNLPAPAIADPGKHFKTVLYEGDGNEGHSITGDGFQPDLVWIKCRSNADDHTLTDVVRGADRALYSNNTNSENTSSIRLQSFDDNGFTTGSSGDTNTNGRTFCAWCWKAGGAAVSNTDGSITTQVSANPTSGFSIVKGSQTSGTTTFGHGLGKAPKMIITKQTNGTTGWYTYVKDIGYDRALRLDQDSASASFAHWVAHPTTSVFSMGSGFGSGEDYVAYCFAEIEGFSKIGVYVGNGDADGSFVYCGFKPAWVLIKNADQNGTYWTLFDSSRKSTNPANHTLNPNLSAVEETNGGNGQIDLVSNGFKCRNTDGGINGEDINYVFLAFAESPFQTANAK